MGTGSRPQQSCALPPLLPASREPVQSDPTFGGGGAGPWANPRGHRQAGSTGPAPVNGIMGQRPGGGGEGLEDLCEWGTEVQWGLTGGLVCEMCDFCRPLAVARAAGAPQNSVPGSQGLRSVEGMVRLSLDA